MYSRQSGGTVERSPHEHCELTVISINGATVCKISTWLCSQKNEASPHRTTPPPDPPYIMQAMLHFVLEALTLHPCRLSSPPQRRDKRQIAQIQRARYLPPTLQRLLLKIMTKDGLRSYNVLAYLSTPMPQQLDNMRTTYCSISTPVNSNDMAATLRQQHYTRTNYFAYFYHYTHSQRSVTLVSLTFPALTTSFKASSCSSKDVSSSCSFCSVSQKQKKGAQCQGLGR